MKVFTGQKLSGWWKVYGFWSGRVFVGVAIARKKIGEDL